MPGHRRRRHRGAEAGGGVLELELGVLVGGEAERPEPLVPLRLHQPPHPHVVAHREVLGVRGADVAQLRLRPRSPLPGRPEHADRERLHGAGRHVDQQPVDLAGGHRLEMLGDGVDVPAVHVSASPGSTTGQARLDEVDELAGAELALDGEPVTLAQAHGRGPPSARPRVRVGELASHRLATSSEVPPLCSTLAVSRQPPRVFIQKIAAVMLPLLGLGEERAADHGIGAGEPEVELLAVVLLQGVERELQQLGDLAGAACRWRHGARPAAARPRVGSCGGRPVLMVAIPFLKCQKAVGRGALGLHLVEASGRSPRAPRLVR